MQSPQEQGARWPYLAIMLCMFVLSITVPLARHAQRTRITIAPAPPLSVTGMPEVGSSLDLSATTDDSDHNLFDGPITAERPTTVAAMFGDLIDLTVPPDRLSRRMNRREPTSFGIRRDRLRDRFASHVDPVPADRVVGPWPVPESLQLRLAELRKQDLTRDWATQVDRLLDQLVDTRKLDDPRVAAILKAMHVAETDGQHLAKTLDPSDTLYLLNCATYALARRIDIWRAASHLAQSAPSPQIMPITSGDPTSPVIYFDPAELLADIEQYEHTRLVSHSRKVARAIVTLQASHQPEQQQLAESLDRHYRNANFRIAVTSRLLERFLPEDQWTAGEVDHEILGVPVWGESATFTRLKVRPLPDPNRLKLGIEARGRVDSDTTANSGPIYLYHEGSTSFLVRKLIMIDSGGLRTKPSVARALGRSDLVGVESDFDPLPLVGPMLRKIGERKAQEQQSDAIYETEGKVAREARRRFDTELNPKLVKAQQQFLKLWAPLETMGLDPTLIELSTSDVRFVTRLRLGDGQQLTAHSARPRAPSDSLASMQLHETTLNNALSRLELDGQTMSLYDLYGWIAQRTGRPVKEVPDTMPKNVFITFADHDAIRVRCDQGQMQLTIALAEVRRRKDSWSDLVVRAMYEPTGEGLDVSLVRTGTIELMGHRLRLRDQIALRGVFSKLLSKSQKVRLVPEKLARDPRLANVKVTQQTIKGGWIGVAIGPSRDFDAPEDENGNAVSRSVRRKQRRESRQ